ncbi:hypothetical protein R1flu_005048 [Riccia fluitans]|uniref:Uncharacterized protein n=1 Tax=Riccia fluitans TaxID=41844 RepID=A0ABD1YT04_9MARC
MLWCLLLPAINDVVATEIPYIAKAEIIAKAAKHCDVLRRAAVAGGLWTDTASELGAEVAEAAKDADLVVLVGMMGRAVHTNLNAKFKCDVLKLAMIKNQRLAEKPFKADGGEKRGRKHGGIPSKNGEEATVILLKAMENCGWLVWMVCWLTLMSLSLQGGSSDGTKQQQCPGQGWTGEVLEENPRLVAKDRSGERYEIGSPPNDSIPVLHIRGSPFELGRAHGTLLRSEIQTMYLRLFQHLEEQVIIALHLTLLPDGLARKIARLFINAALDATYLLTLKNIPSRFVDEMIGLGQGAQVDFDDVVRIQMIPELMQASCSMLGSWGPATDLEEGGKGCGLYQMRALDWDSDAPIVEYKTIIYYHPADGNSFAIFSWAGFIGCVTGYSGRLGISEKVWLNYTGGSSRIGMPWHFLLRDVLQQTDNIDDAMRLLAETPRTCSILVGIGSRKDNKFVLVGYSSDTLDLYDDKNFTLITGSGSEVYVFPGVVYVDKYVQPSEDECMPSVVESYYGKLDEFALLDMVAKQQTGGMHIALYDFSSNHVLFSWAEESASHVCNSFQAQRKSLAVSG